MVVRAWLGLGLGQRLAAVLPCTLILGLFVIVNYINMGAALIRHAGLLRST